MNVLYVALGGALGSVLRYGIGRFASYLFPTVSEITGWVGTLSVNVIGSFLIGCLTLLIRDNYPQYSCLTPLMVVGFCGGFTTFSTFALDSYKLMTNGAIGLGIFYLILSLFLSLLALISGFWMAGVLKG